MEIFHVIFLLCTTIRLRFRVLNDLFLFLQTIFDKNIWSSFIYSFFCARSFNQKLGSSLIYFFYLYTTIHPNIRVLLNLLFL